MIDANFKKIISKHSDIVKSLERLEIDVNYLCFNILVIFKMR